MASGGFSLGGRTIVRLTAVAAIVLFGPSPAMAQGSPRCRILCTPELKIEPTFTVEDLFQRPAIETLENGRVVETNRVERETVFELIFALDVPTEIPRVSLTFEAIFIPFGQRSVNPFTGEEVHLLRDGGAPGSPGPVNHGHSERDTNGIDMPTPTLASSYTPLHVRFTANRTEPNQ